MNKNIQLGFSLSDFYFWPNKRLSFLLKNLQKVVPQMKAIEFSRCFSLEEILDNYRLLKKYQHISFHLGTRKNYTKIIKDLHILHEKLKINYLIIHYKKSLNFESLKKK